MRGLTTHAARSTECERDRAEVLGTISARAPRRSAEVWCGDCGGSRPQGWEAAVLPRGPPQRSIHKQTHRTQDKRLTHSTAPHPVQHTYTMHCATARCVSFIHSFTHSFIHSLTHSLIHSFIRSLIHSCEPRRLRVRLCDVRVTQSHAVRT